MPTEVSVLPMEDANFWPTKVLCFQLFSCSVMLAPQPTVFLVDEAAREATHLGFRPPPSDPAAATPSSLQPCDGFTHAPTASTSGIITIVCHGALIPSLLDRIYP
jgi:hypothetical protein